MKTDLYKCYYCSLEHKDVECRGIFHCPNDLCTGPGAAYFRSQLKSYKDNSDGSHSIDEIEWYCLAVKNMFEKKAEIFAWIKSSNYLTKFKKRMDIEYI